MWITRQQAGFMWSLWWRPVLTLFFPLILSTLLLWDGTFLPIEINKYTFKELSKPPEWKQARAAFIVILMGCYWVSECLPLPITALMPVFLLPLMEIVGTDDATAPYLNSSVMLLTAGCIMAQAFEYSNLHSRIALKVATIVGARIPLLLGGVMFTSMFLSMWMNNTSTTSMMIPVIAVIMEEFEAGVNESAPAKLEASKLEIKSAEVTPPTEPAPIEPSETSTADEAPITPETKPQDVPKRNSKEMEEIRAKKMAAARNVKIMFFLGAAWASNLGGTGIIIGSATNIIAQGAITTDARARGKAINPKCEKLFEITFLGWIEFNAMPMLISTVLTWMILLLWFTGVPSFLKFRKVKTLQDKKAALERQTLTQNVDKAILVKYQQLGSITLHEILVLIIFLVLVVLWVTGKIGLWGWFMIPTFSDIPDGEDPKGDPKPYPHPSIPAVLMCMLLFVIPKDKKYYKDIMNGGLAHGLKDPLLPWSEVETKLPWGPLILIGGGGAISVAISKSGLGSAIGLFLQNNSALQGLSKEAFLAVILVVVAFITTIASNTATASILSPVLIELALIKRIHPLYFLISATTSASYAFILPISTPPNAIAFDKSDMKQKEMALPGIIVTIVTNVVLYGLVHTYCEVIFNFNGYPKNCKD